MVEIKTLTGVSFSEIATVFNQSFSDYYFPIHFSEEQFIEKDTAEGGSLDLSVGAFENGKLIGFINHYIADIGNQKIAYNGGTGVIPSRRGQGLTKKMYAYILPLLKKNRVKKMVLEVLTINEPAIKIYEQLGFKKIRTLDCLKGILKGNPSQSKYELRVMHEYDWNLLQSYWDYNPSWQNSRMVMDNLSSINLSMGAYLDNKLHGYIICNPNKHRIYQLAIDKEHRNNGLGTRLIYEVSKNVDQPFVCINQDTRMISMIEFLNTCGMTSFIQQFEMEAIIE